MKPHLIAVVVFIIVSILYCYPMLQGKMLYQNDMIQGVAQSNEAKTYYEQTGDLSLWTNSAFGGMPTIMLYLPPTFNIFQMVALKVVHSIPIPINALIFCMISAYVLFIYLKIPPLLSAIGSFCFTFSTYVVISLEAGHVSKILAFGLIPGMILGILMIFDKKYLAGLAVLTLFSALEFLSNHIQITYYLFLCLAFYGIYQLVKSVQEKETTHFLKAAGLAIIGISIGAATFATHLLLANEYGKETIRGGSELSSKQSVAQGGLDIDYAFNYSEGLLEPLTLLIPNLYGGGSMGKLSESSNTVSTLVSNGVPKKSAIEFASRMPLYWGEQPSVNGPLYAGALVMFFFVFGLFTLNRAYKLWMIGAIVLMILISFGKNLPIFSNTMFAYFPLYNKFRAVTMALGHANFFILLLSIPAIKWVADNRNNPQEVINQLKNTLYITGGTLVFIAVMGGAVFDFISPNDEFYRQNWIKMTGNETFGSNIMNSIVEDRESIQRTDAFRSLIFIVLGASAVYFFVKKKLSELYFYLIIGGLCAIDLVGVNSRYFSSENFVKAKSYESFIKPTTANLQIMQDKDINYRVMDLHDNTFNSGIASYFHKSVGGYHGAKIRRYQEVIETHIAKNNFRILNMLNTKYFIVKDDKGQPQVQKNPEAMGNAWTVRQIKWVPDADQEMNGLSNIILDMEAYVDVRFKDYVPELPENIDEGASIKLIDYKPNELIYSFKSESDQFVVFSEIFYRGNIDWKSYLDDVEKPHVRCNYILRGMYVPSGEHTIRFYFDPPTYKIGDRLALAASILLFAIVGFAGFRHIKKGS